MASVVHRHPSKTAVFGRHPAIGIAVLLLLALSPLLRGRTNNDNVASLLLVEYSSVALSAIEEENPTVMEAAESPTTPSVLQQKGGPLEYPPLSCPTLLQKVKEEEPISTTTTTATATTTTLVTDPNKGQVHSRETKEPPYFTISLHNPKFDRTRWSIMEWGHYYETALIEAFSTVLNETTDDAKTTRRVLDVGGNIGYFTLLAAAHGNVVVDTFEPNLKNSFRLCQSLQMNRWSNEYEHENENDESSRGTIHDDIDHAKASRVNVHPLGVGKKVGSFVFEENSNPGQGQFSDGGDGEDDSDNKQPKDDESSSTTNTIPVVTLDAFAESRGWLKSEEEQQSTAAAGIVDISIFKVDVEGYEVNVMQGAKRLLQSHMIRNIFMEVSARNQKEIDESRLTLTIIASAGYSVHQYGGFRGPKHTVNWSSNSPNNVTALVDLVIHEVTKKKHPQLNLWWTLSS